MRSLILMVVVGAACLVAACDDEKKKSANDDDGSGGSGTAVGGGSVSSTSQGGAGPSSGGAMVGPGGQGGQGGAGDCTPGPMEDFDGDGYTGAAGDCDDCDAAVNPAAFEVPTDPMDPNAIPADENCDGMVDEAAPSCDSALALGSSDPLDAARALDLCQEASSGPWGVVSAQYVRAGGTPLAPGFNVGLLSSFGANVMPQAGSAMFALSSGHARAAADPNACGTANCTITGAGTPPTGFPQQVGTCENGTAIYDDVALELTLIAPSNATGYAFDAAFFGFDFPEWVCTQFNDEFVALVTPAPAGAVNGNIAFDAATTPIGVNSTFISHCDPADVASFASNCTVGCPPAPNPYCPDGLAFLAGTGFDTWETAGSTGWLTTTAPVSGGDQFTIRLAVWDTGDSGFDSTVMVDNFRWLADPGAAVGTSAKP